MDIDKDILDDFTTESNQLLEELYSLVDDLEDAGDSQEFPTELLKEFSLKIDRIMGAATTMEMMAPGHQGLVRIGKIAELCKRIGYNAAAQKKNTLLPIFAAFWADTIEVIENLVKNIADEEKTNEIAKSFSAILQGRLEWLSKQVGSGANATGSGAESTDEIDVEDILKQLA